MKAFQKALQKLYKKGHTGIPGLWTHKLDAGLSTLDSRRWTLNAGRWTLDAGRWALGSGLWPLHLGS